MFNDVASALTFRHPAHLPAAHTAGAQNRPGQTTWLRVVIAAITALAVLLLTACSDGGENGNGDKAKGPTRVVVDAMGREVTVPQKVDRILMGGQKMLYTTALLNKDNPTDKIVAWPEDLKENDKATYDRYAEKFPQVKDISTTGEIYNNTMSLEQALESRPDVFVLNAGVFDAAKDAGIIDGLEKAGVPTVTVDYFVDPVKNTVPSIRLMGQLMGREQDAEEFIKYYEAKVNMVTERLEQAKAEPTPTFLWRAPGYFDCCSTFAKSNLAEIVELAGGDNLGNSMIDAKQGQVSPEALAGKNPEVIIATGADWAQGKTPVKPGSYVSLGYSEAPEKAAADLRAVVDKQPAVRETDAVKNNRTFAAWHHFYDSPYNFLAVEMFAKAMHPELFEDIDPQREVRELHEQFLPIEASGTFWTGLQ
ncbi:iron ABC transporter substrate-binding protein [Corynebacterium tapiri]|uniref:Iron ABC transporter substrate-binding protein n=2 Tax=Corynebacterium tapiri TaxID=1448266 RepID=A0A5C4U4B9_9CORY|nr:iron ABC transporter substrate-binding protein [Corynebacterium tapiri]